MCQRDWSKYNQSLVGRGSITFFCHPQTIQLIKRAQKKKPKFGRPPYPSQLILLLLLLKISYNLSYRSLQGMAISILSPSGIKIPCYTTISRKIGGLLPILPKLSKRRPKVYLIDSSGFKEYGEGEWKTKVHGKSYHRSWVKVHLLVDSDSCEIIDLLVTSPFTGDITAGVRLLEKIPGKHKQVLADGAYDGRKFRERAYEKGIEAIIPPPMNAQYHDRPWLKERNDALFIIHGLGGGNLARSIWGKWSGYRHRVKVESAFSRLKRLFGASVFSRSPEAQTVEIWLKALVSNLWLNLAAK